MYFPLKTPTHGYKTHTSSYLFIFSNVLLIIVTDVVSHLILPLSFINNIKRNMGRLKNLTMLFGQNQILKFSVRLIKSVLFKSSGVQMTFWTYVCLRRHGIHLSETSLVLFPRHRLILDPSLFSCKFPLLHTHYVSKNRYGSFTLFFIGTFVFGRS